MWGGEINNEEIQRLQKEENTNFYMGPNGNYLQQFITGETLSSVPNAVLTAQVGDNALLSSQIMQHSSFNLVPPRNEEFSTVHGVKRKVDEDEHSSFFSGTKRRITDEHMAAEMNGLYISNEHNYCNDPAVFYPDEGLDMQFSTVSNDTMNDLDLDETADQERSKEYSVFEFTAPLEQMMKKRNDILPPEIVEEICKPCLAMVPWSPPLQSKLQMTDEHKAKQIEETVFAKDEMEDEETDILYLG